jgi:uncharacterized protein (DUF4415 family)
MVSPSSGRLYGDVARADTEMRVSDRVWRAFRATGRGFVSRVFRGLRRKRQCQ